MEDFKRDERRYNYFYFWASMKNISADYLALIELILNKTVLKSDARPSQKK